MKDENKTSEQLTDELKEGQALIEKLKKQQNRVMLILKNECIV